MVDRLGRLVWTAFAAAVVGIFCSLGYSVGHAIPRQADYPHLAESIPLPHRVPERPGGVPFRFAMAHDVIHERFPKHGPEHYRERDRLTREALAKLAPDDPAGFPLADDLGVGLERLGRSDEAVAVLRDKLARQRARGLSGRELYTSYANLGTFLIHASFGRATAGDRDAKARLREGLDLVRESVKVNPQAHFGRERWQAAIAEFLLAATDDPKLLTTFDCLGNRLDLGIEDILDRERNWVYTGYGRPYDAAFAQGKAVEVVPTFFRPGGGPLDDPARWPELSPIRRYITKVGAEDGWEAPARAHREPVPFDEPVLGIIGMWRQGGGANPHFALALGETMVRVGQRYIAWTAYERASLMADRFWPVPAVRDSLRDHCRKRQAEIEKTLLAEAPATSRRPAWQHVSPTPTREAVAGLRRQFVAELAYGEGYQRAYRQFEASKIASGISIKDSHFFDEFHAGRAPIASPAGPEEFFLGVPRARMNADIVRGRQAWAVFGAGVAAILTALSLRLRARPRLRWSIPLGR